MKTKKIKWIYLFLACVLMVTNVPVKAKDFVVCIDPGHQAKGDPKGEPVAPGSGSKKARVASGTAGVGTKKPEYAVNMEAAIILKDLLTKKGYKVVMTRETNDVNVSNIERAEIANNANADMTIRIHCDSIDNGGKTGSVLVVPDKNGQHTKGIYPESYKFAEYLKKALQDSGVKVNGIFERADMTGFNWSKVPVVIFEMGFMSNWNEDKMLCDRNYQTKLMEAVVLALDAYKAEKTGETSDQSQQSTTAQTQQNATQQPTTNQTQQDATQQPTTQQPNALEQEPEQTEPQVLEQEPEQTEAIEQEQIEAAEPEQTQAVEPQQETTTQQVVPQQLETTITHLLNKTTDSEQSIDQILREQATEQNVIPNQPTVSNQIAS